MKEALNKYLWEEGKQKNGNKWKPQHFGALPFLSFLKKNAQK